MQSHSILRLWSSRCVCHKFNLILRFLQWSLGLAGGDQDWKAAQKHKASWITPLPWFWSFPVHQNILGTNGTIPERVICLKQRRFFFCLQPMPFMRVDLVKRIILFSKNVFKVSVILPINFLSTIFISSRIATAKNFL